MEKKYKIGLWINTVIILAALAASIVCLVQGKYIAGSIADIIIVCSVIYYSVIGYKKPHGNLLKELMLLFGLSLIFYINAAIKYEHGTVVAMMPVLMMIIAYIAGRLDRVKENALLMVIVLLGFAHCSFSSIIKSDGSLGFATNHTMLYPFIVWIVLCGAYFTRFKEHKEAGLED